jgi:hypothetical protein
MRTLLLTVVNVHSFLAQASDKEVWKGAGFLSPALRQVYTKTSDPQILDICLLFADNLPVHIAGRVIAAIERRKVTC